MVTDDLNQRAEALVKAMQKAQDSILDREGFGHQSRLRLTVLIDGVQAGLRSGSSGSLQRAVEKGERMLDELDQWRKDMGGY